MRDLVSNIGFAVAIPVAVYAADTTPVALDLLGFNSALIELHVGVGGITFDGTNKVEFVLTHSVDGVTYNAIADKDVQGVTGTVNGIIKSLIAAHAAADITKVGYVGSCRYLKLKAHFSGTHGTGTAMAASLVKSSASLRPVA